MTSDGDDGPALRVAFVCVANAGRSKMAAAFARRELDRRSLAGGIEVVDGGTDPAGAVHGVVVEAMAERGVDLSDEQPRAVSREQLRAADVVVTMGCSAGDVCPAAWDGDARDWGLPDPADRPLAAVRAIRDEVDSRVTALFDELESDVDVSTRV